MPRDGIVYIDLYRAVVIMFIFRLQSLFVGAGGGGCYLVLKTNEMRRFLGDRNLLQERLLELLPLPLSPFCVQICYFPTLVVD